MSELRWRVFPRVSWIWLAWERLYMRLHPSIPIRAGALFAVRRVHDVLELHLDSRALAQMRSRPGYSAFSAVRRMREDLAQEPDRRAQPLPLDAELAEGAVHAGQGLGSVGGPDDRLGQQ